MFKIFFAAKIRAGSHRGEIPAKAKRTAYRPLELAKPTALVSGLAEILHRRGKTRMQQIGFRNGRLLAVWLIQGRERPESMPSPSPPVLAIEGVVLRLDAAVHPEVRSDLAGNVPGCT
jgi:hypothetical protein